jgi:hypothetical protein
MVKRFRVAFSFAGEKRPFVRDVAQILALRFGEEAILYDKFHEAEFARPDLGFYLPDLYANEADLIVVVFGQEYNNKEWCGLEWRAIYGLLKQNKDEGILLMGWDGVQPEGLHGLAGVLSLDGKTPATVAGLILERLARNEGKPRDWYRGQPEAPMEGSPLRPSPSAVDRGGSGLVIRSFAPMGPDPAGLALPPLDLTDLFNDREPIHDEVWLRPIPERIQAVLPEFARLPMPLLLALHTHLSIAWHLGTQLTAKRGFIVRLRQRGQAGEELWDGATLEEPPESCRWQRSELALNRGPDLALVLSVSRLALADVERAIQTLALPIHRLLHFALPEPGPRAIANGSQACWLVEGLISDVARVVQADLPPRIHLFAACPVAMAFLLGQQADALGPTTVYEFPFQQPDRCYKPGMSS